MSASLALPGKTSGIAIRDAARRRVSSTNLRAVDSSIDRVDSKPGSILPDLAAASEPPEFGPMMGLLDEANTTRMESTKIMAGPNGANFARKIRRATEKSH
jgi:hypothetical protein